jgi:hypothetical protein
MKLWLTWCKDDKWLVFFVKPKLNRLGNDDYWECRDGFYGYVIDRPKSIRGRVTKPTCWVGEVKTWKVTK